MTTPILQISQLNKTYESGTVALKDINLSINKGEIFALLGPNGAGKTTLIGTICGIVRATSGQIQVKGADIEKNYRTSRSCIGLVPQELTTDIFETVWATVSFSRGLFGKPSNPDYIKEVLQALALWEKKDAKIMILSGGMKRRVMIAKALSHEPDILFLDEPSAGVDVELRHEMWRQVRKLRDRGVTIILTTHYIEEAELMADRVGVIRKGELILVENKLDLMQKLGRKEMRFCLTEPISEIPSSLKPLELKLANDGREITLTYLQKDASLDFNDILQQMTSANLTVKDITTHNSSLEEIFVDLVRA